MATATSSSRISRVDLRYRHRAQDVPQRQTVLEQQAEREEEAHGDDAGNLPLDLERRARAVMGKPHRMFHRRAAQNAPSVLTVNVNVEVIQDVDVNGNVVRQETVTPALPVVPAVPTGPVPSVPAVPPFPSDLTVPGYPFTSGASTAPAASASSQVAISSPTTATAAESTAVSPAPSSAFGQNTTISSPLSSVTSSVTSSTIILSSPALSSSHNATATLSQTSRFSSSRSSPLTSSTQSASSLISSSQPVTSSASASSSAASTSSTEGGGGFNPASTAAPPDASTTATVSNAQSDSSSGLGTPEVVGTVFGSLAGAALILALLLFLLRRHKRAQRSGAMELTGDDADNQPMTQAANTRNSFVPPSFLNRFSGASRSTAASSATGEKSFQRISGRKLPSAFSEGMTSEQFARDGTLSGSSFYQDDRGIYGGPGIVPKDFAKETGFAKESGFAQDSAFAKETGEPASTGAVGIKERVMPSPARTPVIHHHPNDAPPFGASRNGGGPTLSPPLSPNLDYIPRNTLGRSLQSHDGSRSSRFTENV